MIHLTTGEENLPLAFEVGQHLSGEKEPFNGAPDLPSALSREGAGTHTVTIRGAYLPPGGAGGRDDLQGWSKTFDLAGTLDTDRLARAIYAESRLKMEGMRDGTPPEFYVTSITINPEAKPARKPKPKPKKKMKPKPPRFVEVVRYRDRETGLYAKQSTWERSRRSARAAARKAGRAPRATRYVRVIERQMIP